MTTLPKTAEMVRAYQERDASYDGVFFLGVRTTGIFCRPSCPARKPLARNVQFFGSPREALVAGYRPCKRCRPLQTNGRPPDWAQALLDQIERDPSERIRDADLRALGIEPARARRYFKEHFGMTFQAYHRAQRLGAALGELREGGNLTQVGYGHGYESSSGFREAFERLFGGPPGKHRDADCIMTRILESPVGPLIVCATARALCLLEFTDRRALETQAQTLQKRFPAPIVPGQNEVLEQTETELAEYFAGQRRTFNAPLEYPGTPFQQAVWTGLREIPYGQTRSYEELAERVGRPGAQRAVGRANGQNRIAIVIPCHRVVNKSGQLGGYGGGLWRKQFLLDLERSVGHAPPPV